MRDTSVFGFSGYKGKTFSNDAFRPADENSTEFLGRALENAGCSPFRFIFGQKPGEGYFIINQDSGIKQLLGITKEELTERLFNCMIEEIVPLYDAVPADFSEAHGKLISGELKSYKAEILLRTPGGEKKWILDSSLPMTDETTGNVIGKFGIFFDINEHKQIISSLEEARMRAQESDRLKSAFLRNLSHEIRTPLNAIVGFSTLIGEQEDDLHRKQEFIEIITRNSDHLLEIMTDIVEISDIESGAVKISKEEIDLNRLLERVYERFRVTAAEKNLSLNHIAPAEDKKVNIVADRFKLFQILNNLVGNAVKFTMKGKVEFGYEVKDNKIEFFVADTGPGISYEYHGKIFNSFFQIDSGSSRRYEGIGLGLSISKGYVELLGGEIWLTSQPGEGSVFYFTLPCEPAM